MDIRFYGRRYDLTISAMESRIAEIKKSRQVHRLGKEAKALEKKA